MSLRKGTKTASNCAVLPPRKPPQAHFKIMGYIFLETFVSGANLFKFFAVGWSGMKKKAVSGSRVSTMLSAGVDLLHLEPSL